MKEAGGGEGERGSYIRNGFILFVTFENENFWNLLRYVSCYTIQKLLKYCVDNAATMTLCINITTVSKKKGADGLFTDIVFVVFT